MLEAEKQLATIQQMKDELSRVYEALNLYEREIKSTKDYYSGYASTNRGLIRHRTIDLKRTLTRLTNRLYGRD